MIGNARKIQSLASKDMSTTEYKECIRSAFGSVPEANSDTEYKYMYLYMHQNPELDLQGIQTKASALVAKTRREGTYVESVLVTQPNSSNKKKGWKKEAAIKMYREAEDKSRKNIIALFMSELDMSKQGASTYQQMVKKECK